MTAQHVNRIRLVVSLLLIACRASLADTHAILAVDGATRIALADGTPRPLSARVTPFKPPEKLTYLVLRDTLSSEQTLAFVSHISGLLGANALPQDAAMIVASSSGKTVLPIRGSNFLIHSMLQSPKGVRPSARQVYADIAAILSSSNTPWEHFVVVASPDPIDGDRANDYVSFFTHLCLTRRLRLSYWAFNGQPQPVFGAITRLTMGSALEDGQVDYVWSTSNAYEISWDLGSSHGVRFKDLVLQNGAGAEVFRFSLLLGPTGPPIDLLKRIELARSVAVKYKSFADGEANLKTTELTAAQQEVESAIGVLPEDGPLLTARISLAAESQDHETVLKVAQGLRPQDKDTYLVNLCLGKAFAAKADFPAAERHLKRATELKPTSLAPHVQLGNIYMQKGKFREAAAILNSAVKIQPRDSNLALNFAKASEFAGDLLTAVTALEQFLQRDSSALDVRTAYIGLAIKANRREGAWTRTLEVLDRLPEDAATVKTYALYCEALDQTDEALALWKQLATRDPQAETVHVSMAALLQRKGDRQGAIDVVERGIKTVGRTESLLEAKASLLRDLGRYHEAIAVLKLHPGKPASLGRARLTAELADIVGEGAPAAYLALVKQLAQLAPGSAEVTSLALRGVTVATRDKAPEAIPQLEKYLPTNGRTAHRSARVRSPEANDQVIRVLGGLTALSQVLATNRPFDHESFFRDYCSALQQSADNVGSDGAPALMRLRMYLEILGQLERIGTPQGGVLSIKLAFDDGQSAAAKNLLSQLGWSVESAGNASTIQASEGTVASLRRTLAAYLNLPMSRIQAAARLNQTVEFDIQSEAVRMPQWLSRLLPSSTNSSGLLLALVNTPELQASATSLEGLSGPVRDLLVRHFGNRSLERGVFELLRTFGGLIETTDNQSDIAIPGGRIADGSWRRFLRIGPANSAASALLQNELPSVLPFFIAYLCSVRDQHRMAESAATLYSLHRSFEKLYQRLGGASSAIASVADFQAIISRASNAEEHLPTTVSTIVDNVDPSPPEVPKVASSRIATILKQSLANRRVVGLGAQSLDARIGLRFPSTSVGGGECHTSELDEASRNMLEKGLRSDSYALSAICGLLPIKADQLANFFDTLRDIRAHPRKTEQAIMAGQVHAIVELLTLAAASGRLDRTTAVTLLNRQMTRRHDLSLLGSVTESTLETLDALDVVGSPGKSPSYKYEGLTNLLYSSGSPSIRYRRQFDLVRKMQHSVPLDFVAQSARELKRARNARDGEIVEPFKELMRSLQERVGAFDSTVSGNPRLVARSVRQAGGRAVSLPPGVSLDYALLRRLEKSPADDSIRSYDVLLQLSAGGVAAALTDLIYAVYLSPDDTVLATEPDISWRHEPLDLNDEDNRGLFAPASLRHRKDGSGHYISGSFTGLEIAMAQLSAHSFDAEKPGPDRLMAKRIGMLRSPLLRFASDDDNAEMALSVTVGKELITAIGTDATSGSKIRTYLFDAISKPSALSEALQAISQNDSSHLLEILTLSDLSRLGALASINSEPLLQDSPAFQALGVIRARRSDAARYRWETFWKRATISDQDSGTHGGPDSASGLADHPPIGADAVLRLQAVSFRRGAHATSLGLLGEAIVAQVLVDSIAQKRDLSDETIGQILDRIAYENK